MIDTVEEIAAAEVVEDFIESTDAFTEVEVEIVEEAVSGIAEVVEETTETIIEESGFVTEVIEEKGEQGPPGKPAEDNFDLDLATIYLTAKL